MPLFLQWYRSAILPLWQKTYRRATCTAKDALVTCITKTSTYWVLTFRDEIHQPRSLLSIEFIPLMTTLGERRSTAAKVVRYIERTTPALRTSSEKSWKQLEERVLRPILEPTTSRIQSRGVTASVNLFVGAYQTYEYSLYYIDNRQSQNGKIYKRQFV
jgi:hypothetical protein